MSSEPISSEFTLVTAATSGYACRQTLSCGANLIAAIAATGPVLMSRTAIEDVVTIVIQNGQQSESLPNQVPSYVGGWNTAGLFWVPTCGYTPINRSFVNCEHARL